MTAGELHARWRTPDGGRLAREVWSRLLSGKPLGGLGLGEHEGRVDLRGITGPTPERLEASETQGWVVQELGGLLKFDGVSLADLDMSGGRLDSFRFFRSRIANCRFDETRCQDWRLWAVDVTDSSFVGADLRKAVLGAWYEGRGDTYRQVNFSGANMRSIVCPAATFVDCNFGTADLVNVEFQSTSFVRCRFAGRLRDVVFYDHGFNTGKPDPNLMVDVDFSDAELRMVEFRRLNLDRVKLPNDDDHLVIHAYRCVLERAVRVLEPKLERRRLRAVLEHYLKWIGPQQLVGVFNRRDFVEMGNEAEAEFAVHLLRELEAECLSHKG
jgi:uncharacterized protein YjbI with pentapeptide repeats